MQIEFQKNDNCKLFLEYFSAVREHNPEVFKQGNILEVVLRGQVLGEVEVMVVKTFRFAELNDVVSLLDNGRPVQYFAASLRNSNPDIQPETLLDHVVLRYIRRDLEVQGTLLMNWWTDVYALHSNIDPKHTS